MRKLTETWKNKRERGVALIFAIFTLLLISALAASLVFMSNTETSVNSNYRAERVSSFGAKSGMEEIRDRMALPAADPRSLASLLPGVVAGNPVPGVYPPNPNSVLYVVNEGAAAAGTVRPWVAGNAYMDDELCQDFAGVQGATQGTNDVRCTTPPPATVLVAGENAAAPITSNYPWAGTRAALTYKWVRVTLKQSQSNQKYQVNPAFPLTQVCWNGSNEILVNAPDLICQDNIDPTSLTIPPAIKSATPVYMVTALAVSATGTTRKMVQAEVAQPPAQPFNYGLYATKPVCPALNFHGGGNQNPSTDSYNSKNGAYGSNGNQFFTGGSVGAIGGVSLSGNSQIGGNIGVQSLPGAGAQIPCPGGDYLTNGGNAGLFNPNGNNNPNPNPNVLVQLSQPPPSFPTPPDPSPLPTANSPQPGNPAVPGTYGAIRTNSTLTLAPGVYNIYSLDVAGGNGEITVNPPGTVILNFPSTNTGNVISITGKGIVNPGVPNDFQINYGGTGTVSIGGQGSQSAVVDAPNSTLSVAGNGDFFGRLIGGTIDYGGNGTFHYDLASALRPTNNAGFQLISYREITY